MPFEKGKIVLMGSGELTATMVEVHKDLLSKLHGPKNAVFIDTPAGFQLNIDQISEGAVEYFQTRIGFPLSVASFKSADSIAPIDAEQTFHTLREAGYILVGPGSPTYALRQLQQSPIPEIIIHRVETGGCLVAASAAALTLGRFTLPVYELYKVGEDLHWVKGLDVLGHFGFNLVVIPHWNNAEGGNHDTRFCFMGESRFKQLEDLLPEDISIFGIDEHTACIIDLNKGEAEVRGIGQVIIRKKGAELTFEKGVRFPLNVLIGEDVRNEKVQHMVSAHEPAAPHEPGDSLQDRVDKLKLCFYQGMEKQDIKKATNALLELDHVIWQAQKHLEDKKIISQARAVLKDLIVGFGLHFESMPKSREEVIAPLVEALVCVRENFRKNKEWDAADAIRESLKHANVLIEDTPDGSTWRLNRGFE